jgi:hypothetical protein
MQNFFVTASAALNPSAAEVLKRVWLALGSTDASELKCS